MRILVAESDSAVAQSIEMALDDAGFIIYATDSGAEAIDCGKLYEYDAILLGDTPDLTGCDMLRSLRLAKVKSAIIVLSRKSNVENIVAALNAGADDYMVSPICHDELVARLHAVVRRSKGHVTSRLTVGAVVLNLDSRSVTVAGQAVYLTGKEFAMMELLALRRDQCISKDAFLNALYGGFDEPEAKIIDVFICKLRKKLPPETIETVWGRGYIMRDPALPSVASPSLAPELADLASVRGVGFVPMRTVQDWKADERRRWPSPPIVPTAGQR